jgi:hypothetical protein
MKPYLLLTILVLFTWSVSFGQFNEKSYVDFRKSVQDLSFQDLKQLNAIPNQQYYKGYNLTPPADEVFYLDSVIQKLGMTKEEIDLLMQNHFVVTERLSEETFGGAYQSRVFNKDLPVFVSTDLILHALHTSYDDILKELEGSLLMPNIKEYITALYDALPGYAAKYGDRLGVNIEDVDLYLAVALSLINETTLQTRYANQKNYNQIMAAIAGETLSGVQLFTYLPRTRSIDFSQFKVRGHYVYTKGDRWNLESYFKAMMWLGRIDFPLTPPPTGGDEPEWKFEEIQRMNVSAFILNELMQASSKKNLLLQNNKTITYLVGESDNLTSEEYIKYTQSKGISDASQLMDSQVYVDYFDGLSSNPEFAQKYMGAFYFVDASGDKPDVLPVSFLMSGQRFIIDSYVFANVVFDRIVYKGEKVARMMPDPLDVLYSLGNNDALHFLENELTTYPYGSQLALMRYLIDAKEPQFWNESLYNSWLSSIRALNPAPDDKNRPFFMRTGAWHQQKMNTQLAAWTQLRHDNLLYAKPSYTGAEGCSFPYSYVEPYPEFYKRLGDYANDAAAFFSGNEVLTGFSTNVDQYFRQFADIMSKLEVLAQKELDNQPFSTEEASWLKQMLIKLNYGMCGEMPFDGWILDLYWNQSKLTESDFINVDVHTQPAEASGQVVGKVLHAGLGKLNMGVCLAKIPGSDKMVAYTGAFMSYYENITTNYLRLTDKEWEAKVLHGDIPERPEWVSAYLVTKSGTAYPEQKSLPTSMLLGISPIKTDDTNVIAKIFPNPANDFVNVQISGSIQDGVEYSVTDICGRVLKSGLFATNRGTIDLLNFPKGVYLLKLSNGANHQFVKVVKE